MVTYFVFFRRAIRTTPHCESLLNPESPMSVKSGKAKEALRWSIQVLLFVEVAGPKTVEVCAVQYMCI